MKLAPVISGSSDLAASLATRCGEAYRKANDRTRKLFNAAVFERLDVKGGRLCHEQYRPPFDGAFTVSEFEYGTRVEARRIELPNLLHAMQALYQLSYAHSGRFRLADRAPAGCALASLPGGPSEWYSAQPRPALPRPALPRPSGGPAPPGRPCPRLAGPPPASG